MATRPKAKTLCETLAGLKPYTVIKRNQPHLVIEVRLVTYGYQIDIYDYTLATPDGQNVIHQMECHDWSGSMSICRRAEQIRFAVIKAINPQPAA